MLLQKQQLLQQQKMESTTTTTTRNVPMVSPSTELLLRLQKQTKEQKEQLMFQQQQFEEFQRNLQKKNEKPSIQSTTNRAQVLKQLQQQEQLLMQNHKTQKFQQQMQTTTIRPEIQSTTNRAEVLKLLQQLLASVKPSSPQPTKMSVMTTVRTTRMAVPVTAAATVAPSTATTRRLTVKRQPSLTFDDPHPVLTVSITPPHLSPTVTPGTQIHPHSPC